MNIIEELNRIEIQLTKELALFEAPTFKIPFEAIKKSCFLIGQAWSLGWVGYHAYVYKSDLKPAMPGDFFDIEWGSEDRFSNKTSGKWSEFNHAIIVDHILSTAGHNLDGLKKISVNASKTFDEVKDDLIVCIEASDFSTEQFLIDKLKEVKILKSQVPQQDFTQVRVQQQMTRDSRAYGGGLKTPPHIFIESLIFEYNSCYIQSESLLKITRAIRKYVTSKSSSSGLITKLTVNNKKIFIGHGRTLDWKLLADFLKDRLKLIPSEFNSVPTAGFNTTERLDQLLDESSFAFIVMTAEDEQLDGTSRARENVVHEIGLFQGKLGRKKAIILLEDGCSEFSNIVGLVQIRFPKGKIMYCFEEIRKVLEREQII